jgi:two-component system sensor histidine kinase AtoS
MTCIVLGPIAILWITAFFLKRFTGSVNTLLSATNTLEQGNLDFRIDDQTLKDEFCILANSINGMALSLQEERKKLASMYQLHQTLFESSGDAIMITSLEGDRSGRIISANTAASKLYGYSSDELLEMNVVGLVPEGKVDQFQERVKTVIDGGWSHQRVYRVRKDGTRFPIDLSMGMLTLEGQKHVLSFCRDITDQLHAEEELQRANQMALVGQMAAGLAHEIKNPLAGIKISLDVLADELELQLEDKELFARIINEVGRMEKLLRSLLNYARPPQPQFDLVDINQLLGSSLKNAEVAAAGKSNLTVRFQSYFAEDLPLVEVDTAQMQQVFLNILLNAVDAIEAEGTITVSTHAEGDDHFRIQISDTGKGMPEAALEKIFTPFFTTKTKGTGLGLSICKRLIEQHDGKIVVTSQIEESTSFIMTLPLEQKNRESLHE